MVTPTATRGPAMKTNIILSVVCLLLVGCAAKGTRTVGQTPPPDVQEQARKVRIVTGEGTPATWDDLVKAASGADAVLTGENHGHPLGLASNAALWEDVLARRPQGVLAMEFLERDEQARVDDCIAGLTDVDGMAAALRRDEQGLPLGHRRMISLARERQRPVIAANAPRRYVRLARSDGYDRLKALSDEQRRLYRIPDAVPQGSYRASFDEVMNTNAGITEAQLGDPAFAAARRATLDATFRSQSLWDWTMAESVATGLDRGRPVLMVVGRFHVDHDGGLVQALRAQRPDIRIVTVTFVDLEAPEGGGGHPKDIHRGDFVVYVGPSR
ncbi:MAG: ChaN family lipoprotein [Phycisphaerae bacterium]